VSSYPADTEVPWFKSRVKCGNRVDVRPNRKERPDQALVSNERGSALFGRGAADPVELRLLLIAQRAVEGVERTTHGLNGR
jgi:hypothetical protein